MAPAAREGDGGAGGLSPFPAGEAPLRAGTDGGKGTGVVGGAVFHGSGVGPPPREISPPTPPPPYFHPLCLRRCADWSAPCLPLAHVAVTQSRSAPPRGGSRGGRRLERPAVPLWRCGEGGRCEAVGLWVRDRGGFEGGDGGPGRGPCVVLKDRNVALGAEPAEPAPGGVSASPRLCGGEGGGGTVRSGCWAPCSWCTVQ